MDITRVLDDVARGQPGAMDALLPLVYDELRRVAAAQLAREKSGQTLQATALVHEAYLRMIAPGSAAPLPSRKCFFQAAAEAMRRILVDNARRKKSAKRGGGQALAELTDVPDAIAPSAEDILDVHDALDQLAIEDAEAAELVKLHYFAGLSMTEIAELQGVNVRTAQRTWVFARTWLCRKLGAFDGLKSS